MKSLIRKLGIISLCSFLMTGCTTADSTGKNNKTEDITIDRDFECEISLWSFPVGGFSEPSELEKLVALFNKEYPNIKVDVRVLTYETGDREIMDAMDNGTQPDLVFEGPERLVAGWGAEGRMIDLTDIWTEQDFNEVNTKVLFANRSPEMKYFAYPICMTVHTMAVNKDLFEAADALKYIDLETLTWSTDDFVKAVDAVYTYRKNNGETDPVIGEIYCGSKQGDQGTRALVTNLYSGQFTTPGNFSYCINSEENCRALQLLKEMNGIKFNPEIGSGEETVDFLNGDVSMAFCWNAVLDTQHQGETDFTVLPVAFPSDDSNPELCGGIWGFGIFDTGDPSRIAASKAFIQFLTDNEEACKQAILSTGLFPARNTLRGDDITELYTDDSIMNQYTCLMPYFGEYYQVTPGWTTARDAWFKALQKINDGEDIAQALGECDKTANDAAEKSLG